MMQFELLTQFFLVLSYNQGKIYLPKSTKGGLYEYIISNLELGVERNLKKAKKRGSGFGNGTINTCSCGNSFCNSSKIRR